MKSADTDWEKEILRTGKIQQYSLSLSSGTDAGHEQKIRTIIIRCFLE